MKYLWMFGVVVAACFAAGCSKPEQGDVDTATKAAAAAPKTVEQLPAEMPPQARAAAASAMGRAQAAEAEANDPARVRAMQEMRKRSGG